MKRAEVVVAAALRQSRRRRSGIDTHPAHRIEGSGWQWAIEQYQLANAHGLRHILELHRAERAKLVSRVLASCGDNGIGAQDLSGAGMGGHTRSEVHGRSEVVSVAANDRTAVNACPQRGKEGFVIHHLVQRNGDPKRRERSFGNDHDLVPDRLDELRARSKRAASRFHEPLRDCNRVLVAMRFRQGREPGKVGEQQRANQGFAHDSDRGLAFMLDATSSAMVATIAHDRRNGSYGEAHEAVSGYAFAGMLGAKRTVRPPMSAQAAVSSTSSKPAAETAGSAAEAGAQPAPPEPPPRLIGRQLSAAFLILWVIAAGLSLAHLALLHRISDDLSQMRSHEMASRDSLGLAAAIREQYIHVAHSVVNGNLHHQPLYDQWSERARSSADMLLDAVPASERARVESIGKSTRIIDRVFRQELIPAIRRSDRAAMQAGHERIQEIAMLAASDADLVARSVEDLMVEVHKDAMAAARLALIVSVCGVLLLAAVATLLALRLRAAVLRPLAALSAAAQRLGTGDFETRVGSAGEGELGLLARSFDDMAEQLRLHQKKLVDAERMAAIGQLAAGVAHEINNPIAVIRGYLRTMLHDAPPNLREELEILDDEAAACQRIGEDLLSYSRAGELLPKPVQVGEILRQAVERFGESAEARGREILVKAAPGRAIVDAVRVRQVAQNLLRNALQASPSDSPVELYGEGIPSGYRFRILDRGPGVPESLRAQVFEPFFTNRPGGSGLGLAVCKGIAEAHGGSVELLARDGGGTEVVVTLYDRAIREDDVDE